MASKKPNVKKLLLLGGLAAAGVAAVYVVLWQGRVSTDNAYIKADVTLISPKVGGYISKVGVADNTPVKAGDVLVELENADYTARLAAAQGQVDTLISSMSEQEQIISQAQADADIATANFRRAKTLLQQGASAAQATEEARAKAKSASAGLGAAQAHMDMLASQLKEAEANRLLAAIDLSRTTVVAPQDGIVGNRIAQVGQLVQPGSALMYLIPQKMWVEANYKETQLENMKAGQPARVHVDALGGREVKGRVESFAPASGSEFSILPPENATGNFTKVVRRVPVRIALDADADTAAMLRPGLSVVVTVDTRAGSGK